ncbi:MAG: TIGR01777 family protein [Kineosporiaceae bacterium]|nr:TIGR01777 family protein [Aeromicrobium sp.]
MRIVIGGASGFLGGPLIAHLRDQGHQVTRLVRSGSPGDESSSWDPATGRIDQVLIDRADAVVNLSGAPVAHWPWTDSYRGKIHDSRVSCTLTLSEAIAAAPKPPVFISASGMSYYGSDRGAEELTEQSTRGDGFLADVTHDWENATNPASDSGARVCKVRTSLVLHKDGGTLKTLLPIYKLGLGGKLSSGDQYFSVISRNDWIRGITFLLDNESTSGPFNFANPNPATNAEFTRRLGKALKRTTFMRVPGFAMKAALGPLAGELLGSLRIIPAHLETEGFGFAEPDLASAIAAALR